MAKMRVVQVSKAKGPFEIVEREIPQPGSGDVADQGTSLRRLSQRFDH